MLVGISTIFPALAAFSVGGYICFYAVAKAKILGGRTLEDIPTLHGNWREAVRERLMNMEREGAPDEPILLNPFKHNVPARWRNISDFPEL